MNFNLGSQNFSRLAFATGLLDFACRRDATACRQTLDVGFVVSKFARSDDLDVALARAIVDFDKAESSFGIATSPHPATDFGGVADG